MTALSDALLASSELRCPRLDPDEQKNALIERLLAYTLETAFHQGELARERLEAYAELHSLEIEWDNLQGWHGLVRGKTNQAVLDAKRQINPELYQRVKHGRWLVARLTDEIDRLEGDAVKVSRAYSILSGS